MRVWPYNRSVLLHFHLPTDPQPQQPLRWQPQTDRHLFQVLQPLPLLAYCLIASVVDLVVLLLECFVSSILYWIWEKWENLLKIFICKQIIFFFTFLYIIRITLYFFLFCMFWSFGYTNFVLSFLWSVHLRNKLKKKCFNRFSSQILWYQNFWVNNSRTKK